MSLYLSPSQALPKDANNRFDLATDSGRALYDRSTKSLYPKGKNYDCDPDEMFTLLHLLGHRAAEMDWNDNNEGSGILWIPEDTNNLVHGNYNNLITSHGTITLATIHAWEDCLEEASDYRRQQDFMLFNCLMNTISLEAKAKIQVKERQYVRGNRRHGLSLLKTILTESHLDTNATVNAIRQSISELSSYIVQIDCDITKFNDYVSRLEQSLAARNETSQDLLVNIFKAYKAVRDQEFVKYIEQKESDYEDGNNLSHKSLMTMAENKFKNLVQKKKWCAPSELQNEVVALRAELQKVKKARQKQQDRTPNPNGKGRKSGGKPDWLLEQRAPKQTALDQPRMWKTSKYHWCCPATGGKCDGAWVRHQPKECRGAKPKKTEEDKNKKRKSKDTSAGESKQPKLQLAKAYAAMKGSANHDDSSQSDQD
jgi:hypothetical protein